MDGSCSDQRPLHSLEGWGTVVIHTGSRNCIRARIPDEIHCAFVEVILIVHVSHKIALFESLALLTLDHAGKLFTARIPEIGYAADILFELSTPVSHAYLVRIMLVETVRKRDCSQKA